MKTRKIVRQKELDRVRARAQKLSLRKGISLEEALREQSIRTKNPIRRTIVFLIACCFMGSGGYLVLDDPLWLGVILILVSFPIFYIAFFGNREDLDECITETGDSALEVILESISGI